MTSMRWFAVIALTLSGAAFGALVDGIVATVDTEVILQSDIRDDIAPFMANLQSQGVSGAALEQEFQKAAQAALEQAVEQRILYREATTAGLSVRDEDVEDRINKIKKQYKSPEEFMKALEETGATMSEFRERVKKQIMAISMGMMKRREFEKDAVILEPDMAQYYQDHQSDFSHPERAKVWRIFLGAEKDPAQRKKVQAKLEALREELTLGADFAELAKKQSEGPDAAEGGLVGWVAQGDLVPELEKAVFALEPGQISEPVETEWGFHLLKVEAKEPAGVTSYESARTEIEPILRKKYADERYEKWMQELRKRSHVRIFL